MKNNCERCGREIAVTDEAHPTLFGTVVCIPCHEKQHKASKGKVPNGATGVMVPTADGKVRR